MLCSAAESPRDSSQSHAAERWCTRSPSPVAGPLQMPEEPSASGSPSADGGGPPSRKRQRVAAADLVAREELGDEDEDWTINDRFDFHYCLGAGAYGTVFKAVDRERAGQLVALKKVTFLEDPKRGVPLHILREVQNLKFLHKNCNPPIVRYNKWAWALKLVCVHYFYPFLFKKTRVFYAIIKCAFYSNCLNCII